MKKHYRIYGCIVLYIVFFILIVPQSYHNALQYTFDRLVIGKTFYYPISSFPKAMFQYHIISCRQLATTGNDDAGIECTIAGNNEVLQQQFINNNRTAVWIVLIVSISSIVMVLWGIGVYLARRDIFSHLFMIVAMSIALCLLMYIDVFFTGKLFIMFPAVNILVGWSLMHVTFTINDYSKNAKKVWYTAAACIAVVLSIISLVSNIAFETIYMFTIIMTLLLFFVSIMVLTVNINHKLSFVLRRNLVIAAAIFLGGVVPYAILLTGTIADIYPGILFALFFAIATPVSAGNGLLVSSSLASMANLQKNFIAMVMDIIIAVVLAFSLFYIYNFYSILSSMYYGIIIFVIAMLILLHLRMLIVRTFDDIIFLNNDEYALSLQRIAEIITSPRNLKDKLDSIQSELHTLIRVEGIQYAIIDDYEYGDSRIINVKSDSDIVTFFKKRKETITMTSSFTNKEYERALERYCKHDHISSCIPVYIDGILQGVLLIKGKEGDYFTNPELSFLAMLSLQVHQLIVNSKALAEYIASRNYEKEMDLASYIQLRLFPKKSPVDCGIQFAIYARPYLKVTGDYYDIVTIDKNKVAVVIADISGHGLSAAMILSATSAIINGMLKEKKNISNVVAELNHFLTMRYQGFELITLFIGLFNKKTRSMEYINAGHLAPVVLSQDKKFYRLEGRSKILGVDPAAQFHASRYSFKTGDEMILYTDGLTDLYDAGRDISFGDEGLEEVLQQTTMKPIEEKIHAITEAIEAFGQEHIKDDITIVGMHID